MDFFSLITKTILGVVSGITILVTSLFSFVIPQFPNVQRQPVAEVATTKPVSPGIIKATSTSPKKLAEVAPVKPIKTRFIAPTPPPPVIPVPPPIEIPKTPEIPVPLPATTTAISITSLNEKTRSALVNILCTTKTGGSFRPITGSGVIIDKRGIILTNAHVAEYFLLKDYLVPDFLECVIRTGSPAMPKYKAELLYISPQWISDNRGNIREQNPTGTGEHDFAFLRIVGPVGPSIVMPTEFPALDAATKDSEVMNKTFPSAYITAGYPAGFLGGISVQRDLYIASTVSTIEEHYTFTNEDNIDVISLGSSILAQKGASGGAVVNQQNEKLVGIIVTTSAGAATSERTLRAVTTSHMNRALLDSLGLSVPNYIAGDIAAKAAAFNRDVAPFLKDILVSELAK